MAEAIRVLLVDDHRIVREGLRSMLATQPDMQVVGEAGDGETALREAARLKPDVILLDLDLPGLDGVGVMERLRADLPTARVIILTAYGADERILDAVRAGAQGYLLKGAGIADVLRAIRVAAEGGALLEPAVAARLLAAMSAHLRGDAMPEPITDREREILTLMARGYSNKAIGDALHLAERTVKFYATLIFQKLGVANRAEAVARAIQERIIMP
jgi:DNA-binding NarL/FixJ family response regulator